jgi:hypothetical protein
MSRGPLRFRQADVSRAVRALRDAGVSIARVEVGQEGVVIVPGEPSSPPPDADAKKVAEIDAAIRRIKRRKGS